MTVAPELELAGHTLRLRLRPKAPAHGVVDGAWWPWTHDLATELASLLAVLEVRLGPVRSVSYQLADWTDAPSRVLLDGDRIRLAGFRSQPAHTIDVIGRSGRRVTLLVVPPETGTHPAHESMMSAARRDNVDTVDDLLGAGLIDPRTRGAIERWEIDGGWIPRQPDKDT